MAIKNLSYHVKEFSEKVRTLNQTNGKSLVLTANEARNLQSDIFALLSKIIELSDEKTKPEVVNVELDGGSF